MIAPMSNLKPFVVHEQSCPLERWTEPGREGVSWRTLISADRTASAALTMGVATIAPGGSKAPVLHRHAPPELYYILAGEGVVAIDGAEHAIEAGSVVFIPPDVEHAAWNTGDTEMRLLYVFAADSFADIAYHFVSE